MKFKTIYGATKSVKNPRHYLISWDADSRSIFQTNIKNFLYKYWNSYVVFEEFPIPSTKLSLDFYNATKNIAVEVQGNQHIKYVPFFHNGRSDFLRQLRRDSVKEKFCELNDIKLVLIYQDDKVNIELFKEFNVDLI